MNATTSLAAPSAEELSPPASGPLRAPEDLPIYSPGLPYIGSTLGYLFHPLTYHLEGYRKYGPIFRTRYLQKMQVVIAGVEANEFVWRNSDLWSYGTTRAAFGEQFGPNYLTQLDGEPHRKKRRRLNAAFRPEWFMSRAPAMSRVCAERLAELPGGRADLRQFFCHRLLEAMNSEALLNTRLPGALEDTFIRVERGLLLGGLFGSFRRHWFRRKSYLRDKEKVVAQLTAMVRERMAQGLDSKDDMFTLALKNHPADEPPLDEEELVGDLYVLFLGGLNSTASLCIWSLMEVYRDKQWLAELREEIDAVPPDQFRSMSQWPKIKATIMEVERMRPPTPSHTLMPVRDFELYNTRVPARTPIAHVQALAHFLPENYPDPFRFNPRRFLEGSGDFVKGTHGTFGGGQHRCLGMPLARIQVPLLLANVVARYNLKYDKEPSFKTRLEPSTMPREKRLPFTLARRGR